MLGVFAGGEPPDSPESVLLFIAFINDAGTAKEQFGFALLRKFRSVGSGNGTGASARTPLSCHAAIRKGSLNLVHTNVGGHEGISLLMRRKIRSRYNRDESWNRPMGDDRIEL